MDDRPDTILLYDADRIVIPQGAQRHVLDLLHIPHLGITRTRKPVQVRYYFFGMAAKIAQRVEGCPQCREYEFSKPEEPQMRPTMKPEKAPMERIAVDLFELRGQKYLAMTDYYSSFIMIKCFHKRSSTEKVCKQLTKWMATFLLAVI